MSKKTNPKKPPCVCGSALPYHLVDLITSHVCSCDRRYKPDNGMFREDGTEPNPIVRFDRAVQSGEVALTNVLRPTRRTP